MKRQRLILLMLSLVLLAAVTAGWFAYPHQRQVATLKYPPGVRLAASAPRADRVRPHGEAPGVVRIDLLDRREPAFSGYQRNIFQPLFASREAAMERAAALAEARTRQARTLAAPAPVAEPTALQRELAAIKVQGFLEQNGRKLVFLAKGTEVIVVKQGDVFAGKFIATTVQDQVLIVTVRGSGEQVIIPLAEVRRRSAAATAVRPDPSD
jgi:hypothetical protein